MMHRAILIEFRDRRVLVARVLFVVVDRMALPEG